MQKGTIINILNSLFFLGMFLIIFFGFGALFPHEGIYLIFIYLIFLGIAIFGLTILIHSLIAFKKCNLSNRLFIATFIIHLVSLAIILFSYYYYSSIGPLIGSRLGDEFLLFTILAILAIFILLPLVASIIYLIGFYKNLKSKTLSIQYPQS